MNGHCKLYSHFYRTKDVVNVHFCSEQIKIKNVKLNYWREFFHQKNENRKSQHRTKIFLLWPRKEMFRLSFSSKPLLTNQNQNRNFGTFGKFGNRHHPDEDSMTNKFHRNLTAELQAQRVLNIAMDVSNFDTPEPETHFISMLLTKGNFAELEQSKKFFFTTSGGFCFLLERAEKKTILNSCTLWLSLPIKASSLIKDYSCDCRRRANQCDKTPSKGSGTSKANRLISHLYISAYHSIDNAVKAKC